ncbi:MAG: gabD [Actinomycetia bacterium]|nr:gabD [Actinomycetes bacterium]
MITKNLIDGVWRDAADGSTIAVTDPATDALIADVAFGGDEDIRAAIESSAGAQPAWAALSAKDRARAMRRFVEVVSRDADVLAHLITAEQGKPLTEARGEVVYGLGFLECAAEEATRVYGELVPSWNAAKRISVMQQPVGVTAAITPWNFPFAMLARKVGPALAAGCTQIVKPAPQTPLTAMALCAMALEADIPPGVVNLVLAPGPIFSKVIFADSRVRKVSFTGSTDVGRELIALSARNITRLSLELGGHAPVIVLDDCDIEKAVVGAVQAKFRNNGQSCIAANRFLVASPLYDDFCSRFAEMAKKLTVRPGCEDGDVGPLIDDAGVTKVRRHVEDAVDRGAKVLSGGELLDLGPGFTDRFFEPTVIAGVEDDMLISTEETFGPVAGVSAFTSDAEAVLRANSTPFGLAAYVFGNDASRVLRVVEGLDFGIVGVNDGLPSTAQAPFGGMKASGIGREGGKYVMREYLETKYVSTALS